ncbi:MAG: FecR domain-containing protein [Winogradskyella arenosi]
MNREELIKKWLDHNLTPEEQIAFEQLEDAKPLTQMDEALKGFKNEGLSIDHSYLALQKELKLRQHKKSSWLKPALKIAAILVLGLSLYYYTATLDTAVETPIAQQSTVALPDASVVELNANSKLVFNKGRWSETRSVNLEGEAFFKVAKGATFDVITPQGLVTVLGTQFNVKQRQNYFEVTCYEGSVAVTHQDQSFNLKPGDTYSSIYGMTSTKTTNDLEQPQWLLGESSFKSVPLQYVIMELENQYDITITPQDIDSSRLFTGSFTHNDLDLALQSVTIPLNLNYTISGKSILIQRE